MLNRDNSDRRESAGRRDDRDRRIVRADIDADRRSDQRRMLSGPRRLQMDRRLLATFLSEL